MRELTRRIVVGVRDDGAAHVEARCSQDCSEELAARYEPGRQMGLANDADRPTSHCECEIHHATAAPTGYLRNRSGETPSLSACGPVGPA
jgi:hypothetical protein